MLTCALFSGNRRLNLAAENAPPMRRGESDRDAVRLLQQAIAGLNIATLRRSLRSDGTFDGDFGSEVFQAIQKFQEDNGLVNSRGHGDGIAGRDTLVALDGLARAASLAPTVPTPPLAPPSETPDTLPVGTPQIPSAARLRTEYDRFIPERGKPCQAPISNQCAIRLSIALGRADIGFHMRAAPGVLITHSPFSRYCGGHIEVPHDARSQRLFNHISTFWTFREYRISRSLTGAQVYEQVRGTPAIVFFDGAFTPTSASVGGDHIDFFNGTRIMNDELNYAAPGEPRGRNANTQFVHTTQAIHVMTINP